MFSKSGEKLVKPIYLYITPFFPSFTSWQGGFCMDAVKALQRDGRYEVFVLSAEYRGGDYEINGVKVYYLPRRKLGASEYFEWFFVGWNNRLFVGKLRQIGLDLGKIAVCHIHDYNHYVQYALALKRINPSCITLVHHHYCGYYSVDIGKHGVIPIWSDLLYLKMKREFESVDAHVFISEHCKRHYGRVIDFDTGAEKGELKNRLWLGRFYSSMKMMRSYVWYNGVDRDLFSPSKVLKRHGRFVIGCVANFIRAKSQLDLIRAVELLKGRMPDVRLRLLGTGVTYFKECIKYVTDHGLEEFVEFVPPVPHEKLPEYYRSLDLFVMPSVNEGFCCVNAEANACGVPVIAIEGMPIQEMLTRNDAQDCLVRPHDVVEMAKRIEEFRIKPRRQRFIVDLDSNRLATGFLNWMEGEFKGSM